MISKMSCSWCHEMNRVIIGEKCYCLHCGHRSDLPRHECDCSVCQAATTAFLEGNFRNYAKRRRSQGNN